MWQYGMIIVLCWGVDKINCAMPVYIKPCSKTKDFKSCSLKSGNEAISALLKGDPQLKIPSLLPLKLPLVDVKGLNLKIKLTDIELSGLDTSTLIDFGVDFEKLTVHLEFDLKYFQFISTYDIDGKIMVLPLQGHGPFNLTAENCHFKYLFSFKVENKGGKGYAIIQDDDKLEYKIGDAHIKLDNLFNGNKAMGDHVNQFLNENIQDVIKELGGAVEGTIRAIAKTIGGGVLENVPYEDLFLI